MMAKRLLFIRIFVLVVMIIASFALCWYLAIRFMHLAKGGLAELPVREELNNPRLDKVLLEKITSEFDKRSLYSKADSVNVGVPERDPFYE